MNLKELDSKSPILSLVNRMLLALIAITILVSLFASRDIWVIVPVSIVLALLTLILARMQHKK
jgi:hypothetical protein